MDFKIPENATITAINGDYQEKVGYSYMAGLLITTDKGSIKLLIEDESSCCEQWGHLFLETPDNDQKIVGAKILSISDIEIPNTDISKYDLEDGNETQLQIKTTKGTIQYAVYNSHNGYYSHAVFRQVFDDTFETYL